MKPSELFEALHALITERVPLHIWGACGVGKSQIVAQVASDLTWQFLDIRAVQLDPVDLRGLPRITADYAEWVPPKFLPTSGQGILFLDELTSAPQMTQLAAIGWCSTANWVNITSRKVGWWWQRGIQRPSVACTFPCPGRCVIASFT
jgi:hypothetical protein